MTPVEVGTPGTRYIRFTVDVWFDEEDAAIHITSPDDDRFHTTVNEVPGSKRHHENLYGKLRRMLQEQGKPA